MSKKPGRNKDKKRIDKELRRTDISDSPKWLPVIIFWAVALLIFYPPFVRGLFFKEDMFIYHILTAIVFILLWANKIRCKDYSFMRTPLDWAILAYAGAYLLSLIGAVHLGEAVYGFLKALNLFVVFWLLGQVVRDFNDYEKILRVILFAATGVAIIGLLALAGYSNYPGAIYGGQISSTLQYPNTLAAYLAVISLIGVTLWVKETTVSIKTIYGILSYFLILVTLCSHSKGAWIIFAVGLVLLVVGLPGRFRIKSAYYLLLLVATTLVISSKITILAAGGGKIIILLTFVGGIIVITGQLLWDVITHITYKINPGKLTISMALIIILAGGLFLVKFENIMPDLRSISVIQDISKLEESLSYISRMDFNRWALGIIKDYPLTGAGAGAWNALYHSYQDYQVYTTEVHNHFLQIWVESGTIGLLAFIFIWAMAIFAVYRVNKFRSRENEQRITTEQWVLIWGTMVAALALGMHAAIDFDLSLAAMSILLWVLFALLNAASLITGIYGISIKLNPIINGVLAAVFALLLLFLGSSYAIAFYSSESASNKLEQLSTINNVKRQNEILAKVETGYSRAASLDPYYGTYHANLAQTAAIRYNQFLPVNQSLSTQYYQKAVNEIRQAEALSYYDINVRNSLLNTCIKLGNIELAVAQTEAIVQITPNDINAYNALAKVLWAGIDSYMKSEKYEEIIKLAQKLLTVEDQVEAQKKLINPERLVYWQGASLVLSPESQFNIARANYLLGNYDKAKLIMASQELIPLNEDVSHRIWYAAVLYKSGDIIQAQQLTSELEENYPDLYKQYQQLIKLKFLK
ncbi:MAG: O-antigen ligase family protein [Syntrophomonadaceae bacterium]|nr:O-antigen ligase family protein [Syntrophomonadaceae bacterium]